MKEEIEILKDEMLIMQECAEIYNDDIYEIKLEIERLIKEVIYLQKDLAAQEETFIDEIRKLKKSLDVEIEHLQEQIR
jgi:predicted  nucleic acid-binding Zn-ribbon protein